MSSFIFSMQRNNKKAPLSRSFLILDVIGDPPDDLLVSSLRSETRPSSQRIGLSVYITYKIKKPRFRGAF